jgi:hypothetical protein
VASQANFDFLGASNRVGRKDFGSERMIDAEGIWQVDQGRHLAGPRQWLLTNRVRITNVSVTDMVKAGVLFTRSELFIDLVGGKDDLAPHSVFHFHERRSHGLQRQALCLAILVGDNIDFCGGENGGDKFKMLAELSKVEEKVRIPKP